MDISCQPPVSADAEGTVGVAAEFKRPAGYFLLQAPVDAAADFFGATHYVEVCDQVFGRYGGLRAMSLSNDGRRLSVVLKEAPTDLGAELELVFDDPIAPEFAEFLKRLEI